MIFAPCFGVNLKGDLMLKVLTSLFVHGKEYTADMGIEIRKACTSLSARCCLEAVFTSGRRPKSENPASQCSRQADNTANVCWKQNVSYVTAKYHDRFVIISKWKLCDCKIPLNDILIIILCFLERFFSSDYKIWRSQTVTKSR